LKKLFTILALIILSAGQSLAQKTNVSGTIQAVSGVPAGSNSYVEFALVNCGNNQAVVNGVAVMLNQPVDFYLDANGNLITSTGGTPQLYGNDVISCNGGNTSRYSVQQYANNQPAGPIKYYYVPSTQPFNLNTATPISTVPPLTPLNPSSCPAGQYITGWNQALQPICANLPSAASNAVVVNPSGTQNVAQPAGTSLNIQGKLATSQSETQLPHVDITYYNADNTGVTDSSSNIQAALNFAWMQGAFNPNNAIPYVHLPWGVYKICSPIIVPPGSALIGDGRNQTILQMCPNNADGIVITGNNFGTNAGNLITTLRDFSIYGTDHNSTGTMIEALTTDVHGEDLRLWNHGGRGIYIGSNDEQGHWLNLNIDNVRWPITDWGANETYFTHVNTTTPGITNSFYCMTQNCTNGAAPKSGNWYTEHSPAIWLSGDNVVFEEASIKDLGWISGICAAGQIGRISNNYFEAVWGGIPLPNSSYEAGCIQYHPMQLSAGITQSQTTLPVVDDSWAPNYIGDPTLAQSLIVGGSSATKTSTYDLVCSDASPGSTTACAAQTGIQQGQHEVISVAIFSNDENGYGVTRCLSGSTYCGVWNNTTKVIMRPGGPPPGPGYIFENNHASVARGLNGTSGFNLMCSETTPGQQCAEIIHGWLVDGLEITPPGSALAGFSGGNGFSLRQPGTYRNNTFTATTPTNPGLGEGWIKVAVGGTVGCDTSVNLSNPLTSSAVNGNTATSQNSTSECMVDFVNYGSGTNPYAYGTLRNIGNDIYMSTDAATNSFNQAFGGFSGNTLTATQTAAGRQYNSAYYFYDQTPSGLLTMNRCGFLGMPENTVPAFTCDSSPAQNATQWSTWVRFDPINGVQIVPNSTGVAIGISANYVQNSINLAGTGWPGPNSNVTGITPGQSDPHSGNNATLLTVAAATGNWNYSNHSSSSFTAGQILTTCVWLKGVNGTEVLSIDAGISGNVVPATPVTLTTGWKRYCSTGTNSGTTEPFRFGGNSTSPAEQFYIYNPQTQPGLTSGPDLATTTSILTPHSVIAADEVRSGGSDVAQLSANSGTTIPANQLCGGTASTGDYCDGGTLRWTSISGSSSLTQNLSITSGLCSASGGSYATCTMSAQANWPTAFSDANYSVSCTPIAVTGSGSISGGVYSISKATTGITITFQVYSSGTYTPTEVDCIAKHS
jgi:hypothetical protein